MFGWGRVYGAFCLIAVCTIILSGCGSGSSGNVADSAATPLSTIQTATAVPGAPAGISAAGGTNKVILSWNPVSGATSYNIYWSIAPNVTTITGIRLPSVSTTYIHRGMLPAAPYYYIVTAQNNSGESSASGQTSAVTAPLDGAAPYTAYCAGCHGKLVTSSVSDTSVAEIRAALHNRSAMGSLILTDAQIAAISAALMYNN